MTLWAITSYFNPGSCPYRHANYLRFRRALQVPLITVELFFGTSPELKQGDAEKLLQIQGKPRNLLWQKERLLNLALLELPDEATSVCWLDCDLLFPDAAWPGKAERLLQKHPVIQLCGSVHHLPAERADDDPVALLAGPVHERLYWQPSAMRNHLSDRPIYFRKFGSEGIGCRGNPGLAWAGNVDLLRNHGLYDRAIGPHADSLFFYAVNGIPVTSNELLPTASPSRKHWEGWAEDLQRSLYSKPGFIDQPIYHLWHGEGSSRRYRQQRESLLLHGFDPLADIAVDKNGCWRWLGEKSDLERVMAQYLTSPA